MKIRYEGHSCFVLESGGRQVVLDPYRAGSVPGLKNLSLEACAVFCSHVHADHCGTECVRITGEENPFSVRTFPSFHDDRGGALRGKNVITVLEAEGLMAVHLGDIGCMPEEEVLEEIRYCDVLMIPVGGHYTIGPKEADALAKEIDPRITIPMHYRTKTSGYEEITTLDPFLTLRPKAEICGSSEFALEAEVPEKTLILRQNALL